MALEVAQERQHVRAEGGEELLLVVAGCFLLLIGQAARRWVESESASEFGDGS